MINWHIVTAEMYRNGTPIDGHMYFLSDTKEIYRGTVPFTESVVLYTELPTAPAIAVNKLYINSTALEGKVWNGTDWTTVIQPVSDTVEDVAGKPVSGKAVAAYVAAEMSKMTNSAESISALSWDSAEHLLTITKGDTSTEDIVFDGLGVNLQYTSATGELQLLDASGNAIGEAINLGLEKFVTSGEYDPENQNIILYFDAEKTESVTIPVGSLVDTYTGESSDTVDLTVSNNKFVAKVKISTADGNQITVDDNGLYIAPVDLSGKMDKVVGGVEGNIAVLDADGNIADSGKSFDDITTNSNVYSGVGSAPEDVVPTGTTPVNGDFCIVKTRIGTTEPAKYQHTAYVYTDNGWEAMDGNYSAANVFFPEDLLTTSAIGNITLSNGQATISAAGKNLVDVWNSIFIKANNNFSVTAPKVTVTMNQGKAYEVGTVVTPTYTASLSAGSYQYGPPTGITATSWSVVAKDNGTEVATMTTNSGTFDAVEVTDSTNYIITATATHNAGAVPVNNVGDEVAAKQIAAGSKSGTAATAITGYRNAFYGTTTDKAELTSDIIRSLTPTNGAVKTGSVLTLNVPVGAVRYIFAYPATLADAATCCSEEQFGTDILATFTQTQIDVEGANNFTAIAYKVYYKEIAEARTKTDTLTITL